MIDKVTVTKYKANDGSLHDTHAGAEAHDAWVEKERRLYRIQNVLESDVRQVFEYRFREQWRAMSDYEQETVLKEIMRAVDEEFEKLIIARTR